MEAARLCLGVTGVGGVDVVGVHRNKLWRDTAYWFPVLINRVNFVAQFFGAGRYSGKMRVFGKRR